MEQTDQYSLCAGFRPHFARDALARFTRQGYQIYVRTVCLSSWAETIVVWLQSEGHREKDRKKEDEKIQRHKKIIKFLFTLVP